MHCGDLCEHAQRGNSRLLREIAQAALAGIPPTSLISVHDRLQRQRCLLLSLIPAFVKSWIPRFFNSWSCNGMANYRY